MDREKFLVQINRYLEDLSVELRTNLLNSTIDELDTNPTTLNNDPLLYANKLRSRHNLTPYRPPKKGGFFSFLWKLFVLGFISFVILIGFLWWKFTPIYEVDEENQRLVLLGGVIDIDGKSGKVKVLDQVQFSKSNSFNDSFQMNMNLTTEVDEIDIRFDSGQFTLKSSENSELKFDCKLSQPFQQDMMQQESELIKIDFSSLQGTTCEIFVPENKRLLLEGKDTAINLIKPEFNFYAEISNGHIAITPQPEHDYLFNLEVENGYVGDFKSSESESATEIQIRLQNGSIVTK